MAALPTSSKTPEISVVVPCHNEEGNLPLLVEELRKALAGRDYEVVIVNDNSTDNTGGVAEELNARYGNIRVLHRRGDKGVGRTLREGFRNARGEIVITMDGDLSHHPSDLPRLLDAIRNADVVLGSRFIEGGGMTTGPLRPVITGSFNLFARVFSGLRVKDLTTGYRAHRKKVLDAIPLECTDFDIHLEIPLLAGAYGFRVAEAPIHYLERHSGTSKLRYSKVWFLYVRTILRSWWRYRVRKRQRREKAA